MSLDSLPRLAVCILFAWTCFYAPALALLRGRGDSALPLAFARVLWSTVTTTLVATILAAIGHFSLTAVMVVNLALPALSFPLRKMFRGAGTDNVSFPRHDFLGPLVFVAALVAYWPGYPAFLGASDSTAYVATGISLAHHGTLSREDPLGAEVPPTMKPILFDSMSQVFGDSGPPYRRMPGAMLLEDLNATKAWPDFFPVPSVWSALFVQAGATAEAARERAAPNYAPVFAALALWAFSLLARQWLGTAWGVAATLLLAASAPFFLFARLPMSEPIAAFFAMSSLAVLTRAGVAIGRVDAILAGVALGAAVFTRVETAMLVAIALALQPSLERREPSPVGQQRHAPPAFFVALAVVAAMTILPATSIPGTWQLPLLDHAKNAWIRYILAYGMPTPGQILVGTGVATTLAALSVRHFGGSATRRWTFLCAVVAGHATASKWLWDRVPMWLSFAIGWQGIAMAGLGMVLVWRSRNRPAAASFVLALLVAVATILSYNPHVYPALPWGARRFVPLLLPLALLMASHAARIVHSRNRIAGLAMLALLAWPVGSASRPLWRRTLVEGSWDTLVQLDAVLPKNGTIFVDREVSSVMAAPALWLARDRNNLTVPAPGTAAGHALLPGLVWYYANKGPVYFLTRGAGVPTQTPKVSMKLVARVPVTLPFLEQTYDRRPERIQRFLVPLAVYRLEPSLDPAGSMPQ